MPLARPREQRHEMQGGSKGESRSAKHGGGLMSRYQWPHPPAGLSPIRLRDDPAARAGHNSTRLRTGLGQQAQEALAASRQLRVVSTSGGGQSNATVSRAPASNNTFLWQPLGPAALLNGQAAGNPWVSGRVNALQASDNGQRLYIASANGGVWYSGNAGGRWESVGGLAATQTAGINRPAQRNACGALLVVFGATQALDVVFLGTGEIYHEPSGSPGSSEGGVGILVANHSIAPGVNDPWVREAPNLVGTGVYRLARDPAGGANATVVAATRKGLFQRPVAPGPGVNWALVAGSPFDSFRGPCTDALWTPAHNGAPPRLWVWVSSGDGDQQGLWVRDNGGTDFERVPLVAGSPHTYSAERASLAAATPPALVYVLNSRGGNDAHLFQVRNKPIAGTDRPDAEAVTGTPNVVHTQGDYNLALAVDPSNRSRVVLGGSFLGDAAVPAELALVQAPDGGTFGFDAAIVVGDVLRDAGTGRLRYGTAVLPWKMIGLGTHADVHDLVYTDGGLALWAACDGGVFVANRPNTGLAYGIAAFRASNRGLSISEPNFIACHPNLEGYVLCGLQDNGVAQRLSNSVWNEVVRADGGGVILDANQPDRWLAQYTNGQWSSSSAFYSAGPLWRTNALGQGGLTQPESDNSAFYSAGDCVRNERVLGPALRYNFSQIILGTTQLWTTEDFGANWVSLPSATDTIASGSNVDQLGQAIISARWQGTDTAWVLTASRVLRYSRTPGSHNAGGAGTWAPVHSLLQKNVKNKDDSTSTQGPLRDAAQWTELVPNPIGPPGGAVVGALYLGTTGHPDKPEVDTLWWYDGVGQWFPTLLRRDAVPAPVTAIAVEAARPDEVWVGTTVGVWHGLRSRAAGVDPARGWNWVWTQQVNGLPEAAVEDLCVFSDGGLRLLRAAVAARGVWEMRLDQPVVPEQCYLRAHDDDLRHRSTAAVGTRDGTTLRSWHGSPDVRPRAAPQPVPVGPPPPAAPFTNPWTRLSAQGSSEQLRRFQAALRSSTHDLRIAADGQWDHYFSEVLRDHGAATVAVAANNTTVPPQPAYQQVQITPAYWTSIVTGAHALAEPWEPGLPCEAELLSVQPPLSEGTRAAASCRLPAAPCKVEVVQHRGRLLRPGSEVRVTLLQWLDPRSSGRADPTLSSTWPFSLPPPAVPDPVPWAAAVNTVLNSTDGADPGALTEGWSFVGTTNATRRQDLGAQQLSPLDPGVVSFDLDLSAVTPGRLLMLVAVLRAGSQPSALAAMPLEQMALDNAQVAVRSVQVV
jgi:hypothetical protein